MKNIDREKALANINSFLLTREAILDVYGDANKIIETGSAKLEKMDKELLNGEVSTCDYGVHTQSRYDTLIEIYEAEDFVKWAYRLVNVLDYNSISKQDLAYELNQYKKEDGDWRTKGA